MAIKGSLKEASLPDVLQLLSMGEKTGILSVTDRNDFGNIYLRNGKVVYATLVNKMDRIGDLLLRDQKITRIELEQAVEKQHKQNIDKRLGKILIDMGVISDKDLDKYLRIQIEETIYTMLKWDSGFFNFEPDKTLEKEKLNIAMPANDLLLEGARKIDEWKRVENTIPSLDAILDFKNASEFDRSDVDQRYHAFLNLINGNRTIGEICESSDMDTLKICKFLQNMIQQDVLFVKRIKKEADEIRIKISKNVEHLNLGLAFYKSGMFTEAEREFKKLLSLDSKNMKALFYIGLIKYHREDYEGAIENFNTALEVSPRNAKIYNNLGLAQEKMGSTTAAFMSFQKATKFNPQNAKAFHNLGQLYYEKEDYDKAITFFKKSIELDENNSVAYFYLGLTYIKLKEMDKAIEYYEKAIENNPGNARIHNNLGAIYQFKKIREKSISHYKEAIRKDTNLASPHRNLGNLYYQGGLHKKALTEFRRAIEIDDTLSEVLFKMGNIQLKQGKKEEAIEYWTKALELDPENSVIKRNLQLIKTTPFLG